MLLTTMPAYLYGVTLLFVIAVKGASFALVRNSDDSPDADFQKTDWVGERVGRLALCRDETCRSVLRVLGSRRSCLSSCLRAGILPMTTAIRTDAQDIPGPSSALTANDVLAECVYARCFHGDDSNNNNRIRKESIAGCISGPCVSDESTEKEPQQEEEEEEAEEREEEEEEKAEAEAEVLRALRFQYKPRSLRKRGYSDATDICIQFHCANAPRGTLVYLKCIKENRCNGR